MLGGATDHIPATRPPRRRLARCRVPANGGPRSVLRPFVHRLRASFDITVLPFETHVNKPKPSLPTTDYALKLEVIFCVQGVITPPCGVPAMRATMLPSSICTGALSQRST